MHDFISSGNSGPVYHSKQSSHNELCLFTRPGLIPADAINTTLGSSACELSWLAMKEQCGRKVLVYCRRHAIDIDGLGSRLKVC